MEKLSFKSRWTIIKNRINFKKFFIFFSVVELIIIFNNLKTPWTILSGTIANITFIFFILFLWVYPEGATNRIFDYSKGEEKIIEPILKKEARERKTKERKRKIRLLK